jgi:hypothetical protein
MGMQKLTPVPWHHLGKEGVEGFLNKEKKSIDESLVFQSASNLNMTELGRIQNILSLTGKLKGYSLPTLGGGCKTSYCQGKFYYFLPQNYVQILNSAFILSLIPSFFCCTLIEHLLSARHWKNRWTRFFCS